MSCANCDSPYAVETYVRVGPANVMVVGCSKHLQQLLEIYKRGSEVVGSGNSADHKQDERIDLQPSDSDTSTKPAKAQSQQRGLGR